jgi:uncharacterized protein (DUF433 family)
MADWIDRFSVNPNICHGIACIRETRIPVAVVLDNLAAGVRPDEILRSCPGLIQADIDAAVAYAAELVRSSPY